MATWSVFINRTTPQAPFTFQDLQNLQDSVLEQLQSQGGQALLFAEVEPVVTLGQRQVAWEQIPDSVRQLDAQKTIQVVAGNRGGNETWHGPGQWVCFVLAELVHWVGDSRGVRKAIDQTLGRILPVIQEDIPEAVIEQDDRLGIWSPSGKIVSIGIKVQKGWLKSGFSVNVFRTPHSFFGINPCGLNAQPDFLLKKFSDFTELESRFVQIPKKLTQVL